MRAAKDAEGPDAALAIVPDLIEQPQANPAPRPGFYHSRTPAKVVSGEAFYGKVAQKLRDEMRANFARKRKLAMGDGVVKSVTSDNGSASTEKLNNINNKVAQKDIKPRSKAVKKSPGVVEGGSENKYSPTLTRLRDAPSSTGELEYAEDRNDDEGEGGFEHVENRASPYDGENGGYWLDN